VTSTNAQARSCKAGQLLVRRGTTTALPIATQALPNGREPAGSACVSVYSVERGTLTEVEGRAPRHIGDCLLEHGT